MRLLVTVQSLYLIVGALYAYGSHVILRRRFNAMQAIDPVHALRVRIDTLWTVTGRAALAAILA